MLNSPIFPRSVSFTLGSENETAPVHHAARRRGGRLAARGARAAAGDAGDRRAARQLGGERHLPGGCLPAGPQRSWLRRRPERRHRISLGTKSIRSDAGASGRSGRPSGGSDAAINNAAAFAAKAATTTIPIVFETGTDPVRVGLVASLARPVGNLTGVTFLGGELAAKQFELLHETVPKAATIGLIENPTNPIADAVRREVQEAASAQGQRMVVAKA